MDEGKTFTAELYDRERGHDPKLVALVRELVADVAIDPNATDDEIARMAREATEAILDRIDTDPKARELAMAVARKAVELQVAYALLEGGYAPDENDPNIWRKPDAEQNA